MDFHLMEWHNTKTIISGIASGGNQALQFLRTHFSHWTGYILLLFIVLSFTEFTIGRVSRAADMINSNTAPQQGASTSPNFERWINTGWRFHRDETPGSVQASMDGYDDASWDKVSLPHTPRLEKFDQTHPWQGTCWYRKTITPDPAWKGKQVSIQFGAAMQVADVWVNGEHKTRHLGGYLPFTVDLTGEARSDKPIVVAVLLDNRDTNLVPPGTPTDGLDFNYPGGLYRGVKLIVTDPVHISDPISANIVAGGGIFVTYTDVSKESATIHVKTDIANDSGDVARNCVVRQSLVGSDGVEIASDSTEPVMIPGTGHHEFVQSFVVDRPRLWDPDHPNRYILVTTISHDGHPADEVSTRIGIRTFTLGNHISINGSELRIAGSNRHQEHPYIEYALSPNASRRDAQRIKEAGLNHIRLSHYPQDPAFLDACDELGILVQAPIPGWQYFQYNSSFVGTTYQNIRDLIRRDRNHPSIIFWEPNLNETDGDHLDWCRTAYEIAHEEYPGDQCFTFGDGYPAGWQPGWDVRHFVREYGDFGFGGNESTSRHTRGEGEGAMLQQAWNFQWCHNQAWANWANPKSKFDGDATWCMFDYNRGYYAKPCTCGMMDIFRLPKYVYYFFQSQRDPKLIRSDIASGPMLFIANDWTKRTGKTKVVVFSNCEEVVLSVNGKEIQRRKPDAGPDTKYSDWNADIAATTGNHYDNTGGHPYDGGNAKNLDHPPFTFTDVSYASGEVKAVGYIAGKAVASQTVHTPGTPAALKLSFDTQSIAPAADDSDTVFVRAEVVDGNGTIVPINSLPSLNLTASGQGRLIGIEPIHVEAGVASVLLQTSTEPGNITITASAEGLHSASETIRSIASAADISRSPRPNAAKASRPIPGSFTKLAGRVLGTPGAYANGSTTIANAFDGNTETYVDASEESGGDGCWLGLDLGAEKTITKIRFYPRHEWARRMIAGKFQGSSTPDFAKPVDLYKVGGSIKDNQWVEITDIAPQRAFRYVRYLSPGDGWNNVAEVEFYTSP